MKRLTTIIALFSFILSVNGQNSYDDVCLLINSNSTKSITIGEFFANSRGLSEEQVIYYNCTISEEIQPDESLVIRNNLRDSILSRGIQDKLNYIILSAEFPINVLDSTSTNVVNHECKYSCYSFDSKLGLMFYDSNVDSYFDNPYFFSNESFNVDDNGYLLVSRLDGLNQEDVIAMIDNSSENAFISDPSQMNIVIDYIDDHATGGGSPIEELPFYADAVSKLTAAVEKTNFNLIYDREKTEFSDSIENTIGHFIVGWAQFYKLNSKIGYVKGAFSGSPTCFFATTLNAMTSANKSEQIGDMVKRSGSGFGTVGEIFPSEVGYFEIAIENYYGNALNIAESFYSSLKTIPSKEILIGDPKQRLIMKPNSLLENEFLNLITAYPNPSSGLVKVENESEYTISIQCYNSLGQIIESSQLNGRQINYYNFDHGIYYLIYNYGENVLTRKIVVN